VIGVLALKFTPSFETVRGEIRFGEPMAKHTSWRVGGPVDYWFVPEDQSDLVVFLGELPEDMPLLWTGLGSNLLVRDGGIHGAVICTHRGLSTIESINENKIWAQAGVACAKVARYSVRSGLQGAEFMAGIPGTVGGALAMNAGAFDRETWDIVKSVEVLGRDGVCVAHEKAEFQIGYRNVSLSDNQWFTGAIFQLQPGNESVGQSLIRRFLSERSLAQPIGNASAGSVFQNPDGDHAARLIENAGLKGRRVGGAIVSRKHANFIINDSQASAADIERLIELVKAEVREQFEIELQTEIQIEGIA
jgi:UDP-N-acetylmuramate dehydrogenase